VYDLVVGGGTGGLVSARIAAALGARVLLAERERTGGDCLWTGCGADGGGGPEGGVGLARRGDHGPLPAITALNPVTRQTPAASPCGSPTTAGYCGDDIEKFVNRSRSPRVYTNET